MARHALIVGAGIIGSATAYALAREGWDVTLVDRNDSPSQGASDRNGGQLTYANVEPLASPQTLRHLAHWLFAADSPIKWRPRAELSHFSWLSSFLRHCTAAAATRSSAALLELSQASRQAFHQWLPDFTSAERDAIRYAAPGKLVVYREASSRNAAVGVSLISVQ